LAVGGAVMHDHQDSGLRTALLCGRIRSERVDRPAIWGMSEKWAFKGDTVSFQWVWSKNGQYRDVLPASFQAYDKTGAPVERGERGSKNRRIAPTRFSSRIERE